MIQRKQSLFLLMAAIVMGLLPFFSISKYYGDFSYILYLFSFHDMANSMDNAFSSAFNLPLIVLWVIIIILSIFTIFLYKKRQTQLRLTSVNIGLIMVFILLVFLYYSPKIENALSVVANYKKNIGIYIPLVTFVLLVLSYKNIKKDITKIKSADRLR